MHSGAVPARQFLAQQDHVRQFSMPVLVVNESSLIARSCAICCGTVDSAQDGSAALAKMRKKRYGLVISDWNMEPMTGYDFLLEIRNDRR